MKKSIFCLGVILCFSAMATSMYEKPTKPTKPKIKWRSTAPALPHSSSPPSCSEEMQQLDKRLDRFSRENKRLLEEKEYYRKQAREANKQIRQLVQELGSMTKKYSQVKFLPLPPPPTRHPR